MKVKLYTRDGGFVAEGTTLPFQLMPEVMIWGTRIFVRNVFMDTGETYGYIEACAFVFTEGAL